MNKLIKTLSSLLCAFFIVFSFNTVCTAAETYSAEIVVNDTELGSNFEVRIKIGKTKGIFNGSFNVVYDSEKVELINAHTQTEMMNGVFFALNDKYTENSVRISFAAAELFGTNGGELMVLNFKAKQVGEAKFSVEKLKLVNQISQYETTDTVKSITINALSLATQTKESTDPITTATVPVNDASSSTPDTIATTTITSSALTSSETVSTTMNSSYSSTKSDNKTEAKGTTISSDNTASTTDSQAVSESGKSAANSITDIMDIISIICALITGLIVLAVLAVIILRKIKQNNN